MNKNSSGHSNGQKITNGSAKTRGAAIRAQRRNQDDANKVVNQYADASQKTHKRANIIRLLLPPTL
jgi:hypothetical protein